MSSAVRERAARSVVWNRNLESGFCFTFCEPGSLHPLTCDTLSTPVSLSQRFNMSLLAPALLEVRKQFLGTRVAVFPDLHFAFFGQVSRAVISDEVCSPLRRVGMKQLPRGCAKRQRAPPARGDPGAGVQSAGLGRSPGASPACPRPQDFPRFHVGSRVSPPTLRK